MRRGLRLVVHDGNVEIVEFEADDLQKRNKNEWARSWQLSPSWPSSSRRDRWSRVLLFTAFICQINRLEDVRSARVVYLLTYLGTQCPSIFLKRLPSLNVRCDTSRLHCRNRRDQIGKQHKEPRAK